MVLQRKDLICLALITLTIPIFFYKLGQSSLNNWDEAWYAGIARTITQTGDLINLKWNGVPYLDHPPFGFWIEALTFKIFGINEFWARFPQAVSGLFSLYLVYFIGKELFNRQVGLVSALALSSAFWFVSRARSGNLDVLLTFMFLLSFYLSFKAVKNQKYLLPFSLSLSLLFLTKTMVPFLILPGIAIILWPIKNKVGKYILTSLSIFLLWFIYQTLIHPGFVHSYLDVGLRGVKTQTDFLSNILLTKTYLYNGIGRWFWPGILGLILIILLNIKRLLSFVVFVVLFLLPFIFSPKVQIWHLIPLYPYLLLSFFGGMWIFSAKYFHSKRQVLFSLVIISSFFFYKSQVSRIWYQMVDIPSFISDEAILSKEAGKYTQNLLTDGDFDPAANFYSQKIVSKIKSNDLAALFQKPDPFLLITNDWRLSQVNIDPQKYKLIKKDRDKVLVLH